MRNLLSVQAAVELLLATAFGALGLLLVFQDSPLDKVGTAALFISGLAFSWTITRVWSQDVAGKESARLMQAPLNAIQTANSQIGQTISDLEWELIDSVAATREIRRAVESLTGAVVEIESISGTVSDSNRIVEGLKNVAELAAELAATRPAGPPGAEENNEAVEQLNEQLLKEVTNLQLAMGVSQAPRQKATVTVRCPHPGCGSECRVLIGSNPGDSATGVTCSTCARMFNVHRRRDESLFTVIPSPSSFHVAGESSEVPRYRLMEVSAALANGDASAARRYAQDGVEGPLSILRALLLAGANVVLNEPDEADAALGRSSSRPGIGSTSGVMFAVVRLLASIERNDGSASRLEEELRAALGAFGDHFDIEKGQLGVLRSGLERSGQFAKNPRLREPFTLLENYEPAR